MLIKLKLRKPKSKKIVIETYKRDRCMEIHAIMHGTVDDSELRTRSSSIKSVLSNYHSSNSDHESVTSYEEDVLGSKECGDEIILSDDSSETWVTLCNRDIFDYEYSTSYYPKKKRLP